MLVVNLYGGPGTGKSTTAAFTFAKLKQLGVNAEYVAEFAKDLTWEERYYALRCQPYVVGKQLFRLERLMDKVEVVVADSPVLLCTVYGEHYGPNFRGFVKEIHDGMRTLDVFLVRNPKERPYNPKGRNQTEAEAMLLDERIRAMLDEFGVGYVEVQVDGSDGAADEIVAAVQSVRGAS